MKFKVSSTQNVFSQAPKKVKSKMDKKVSLIVIGEFGYYSLFAEGYLRFYSAQKLKIKTSAFKKMAVPKKVTRILEEDMIPSKVRLINLADITNLQADYLLFIGEVPTDFSMKTKGMKVHTIKIKKDLSLAKERDAIKKKMLKFLDKQGLYGE